MANVFGLDIYEGGKDALLERIYSGQDPFGVIVVTPNIDHLERMGRDDLARKIYQRADLYLVDGVPLLVLCRALGYASVKKISGSELMPDILEHQAKNRRKLKFGILGGYDAGPIIAKLKAKYPFVDVLVLCPPAGFDPEGAAASTFSDQFRSAGVDLIFVCLGMPKQEIWADRFKYGCGARWILCVGGALDFVTGDQKRAPQLISDLGFEWLWRLAHSPGRLWKRYAKGLLWIGPAFVKEFIRKRGDA